MLLTTCRFAHLPLLAGYGPGRQSFSEYYLRDKNMSSLQTDSFTEGTTPRRVGPTSWRVGVDSLLFFWHFFCIILFKKKGVHTMQHKVLIVDDESTIRDLLKDALSNEPYGIMSASSAEEALPILAREQVDVVVSDEIMPGMSGSEFLAIVRQKYPDTIRIILTGHASLESAIRAINEGEIYRFFTKPCNVFDLAITIRQALKHNDLMKESKRLLKIVMWQSAFIEELEKQYPGITKVKRGTTGEVIIDDEIDTGSGSTLIEQISAVVKKCKAFFLERS
jgi:two-component system probable response regulator PhcQ